jgi:hypothetical protein
VLPTRDHEPEDAQMLPAARAISAMRGKRNRSFLGLMSQVTENHLEAVKAREMLHGAAELITGTTEHPAEEVALKLAVCGARPAQNVHDEALRLVVAADEPDGRVLDGAARRGMLVIDEADFWLLIGIAEAYVRADERAAAARLAQVVDSKKHEQVAHNAARHGMATRER